MQSHKCLIIGGGFGGIRAALDLSQNPACEVTLISKNEYFEYYPGLHKIMDTTDHPIVRIPLATIFAKKKVNVRIETVTTIDAEQKIVSTGQGTYTADFLVLALGSQTEYFGIAGLPEMSFGFKSVADAQRLRAHIEEIFSKHATTDKVESVVGLHMVIVGGGPNGVDLAGELAVLGQSLAKKYAIVESLLTIDLIEASSRILGMMPEEVSRRCEARLRSLGVNVLCNRDLKRQDSWTVILADMVLGAKTLIWTAGITTNDFVKEIKGLQLVKKNRVAVDEYLQGKDFQGLFCIGDIADTPYSGLAQTALFDASYVAKVISNSIAHKTSAPYIPKPVAFNIGVGPFWSAMMVGKFVSFGFFPHMVRIFIDIKFFLSILSVRKVWMLYFPNQKEVH